MLTSLLINVLLATSAFAVPRKLGSTLAERVAAREARRGNTLLPTLSSVNGPATDASHVQFSSNWAGGVITTPPAGQKFTSVTGQFNAPTPFRPPGAPTGTYSASAWVGIDGDTFQNAILQSGIDFSISAAGAISYAAWFEWFPNFAIDFTGITISAGNTIKVTVTSTSSTTGTVLLQNLSTGRNVSTNVSAPSSSAALGGQNAEWIVEDFESGGKLVNFADFNTITFSNCVASTGTSSLGTSGATIIEIKNSAGTILTNVSIPSSSSVVVTHT